MIERFHFDFDELENNGPYCPTWTTSSKLTGFVDEVVGPFLRIRDRYRRLLIEHTMASLAASGDRMTARLQFDGGERPRLIGAEVEGEAKRYVHGEPTTIAGETTVELGDGQVLKARGMRIYPIHEVSTDPSEGERS